MTIELDNKIKATLHVASEKIQPADDAWAQIMGRAEQAKPSKAKRWTLVLVPSLAAVAAVAVAVFAFVAMNGDGAGKKSVRVATNSNNEVPLKVLTLPSDALPGRIAEKSASLSKNVQATGYCADVRKDGSCVKYGGISIQSYSDGKSFPVLQVTSVVGMTDAMKKSFPGTDEYRDVTVRGLPAKLKVSSPNGGDASGIAFSAVVWTDGDNGYAVMGFGVSDDEVLKIADALQPTSVNAAFQGYALSSPKNADDKLFLVRPDGKNVCLTVDADFSTPQCSSADHTFLARPTEGDNRSFVIGAAPLDVKSVGITGPGGQKFDVSVERSPVGDFNVVIGQYASNRDEGFGETEGIYDVVARNADGKEIERFRQVVHSSQNGGDSVSGYDARVTGDAFDVAYPEPQPQLFGDGAMFRVQPLNDGICLLSVDCSNGTWKLSGAGVKVRESTLTTADESAPSSTWVEGFARDDVTGVTIQKDGKFYGGTGKFVEVPQLPGWKAWSITATGIDDLVTQPGDKVEAVFYSKDGTVLGTSIVYGSIGSIGSIGSLGTVTVTATATGN